jgi:hypothetical protein
MRLPWVILTAGLTCACVLPQFQREVGPIGVKARSTRGGTLEVLLDVKVDDLNVIQSALGTFKASFTGFPHGSSLSSAHINAGAIGARGPVVVDLGLEPGQVTLTDGTGSFLVTVPIPPPLANQFITDASAFYFQVDMARMPGALQGQLQNPIVTYRSDGEKKVRRYRPPTAGDLWGDP